MNLRSSPRSQPLVGFTLIELLVVITVVAILVAVAVPAYTQMVANNRVRSVAGALQAALLKARSEALKRNCTITVARNVAWSSGWDVYATELDCSRAAGDEYALAPLPGLMLQRDSVAVIALVPVPSDLTNVRFLQSGRIQGAGPAFYIRDEAAVAKRKCVVVELDGMPRIVEAGKHARCPEPA
jgi:type IV fimbrial biogenesis protein FimT